MQDALNKVRVEGHQLPHPEKYHGILQRILHMMPLY